MGLIETMLGSVARFQKRFTKQILIFVIIFTIILGVGIKDIMIQTDLTKEMPQDLPIFKLNDKITDTFGGQDTVVLLIELDESLDVQTSVNDIRHPYVIMSIMALEDVLNKESAVDSVTSITSFFNGKPFLTLDHTKAILDSQPSSSAFFSRDYKSTLMYIQADIGSSEEKIIDLAELVQKNIDSVPSIPGTKISLTGNPPIRVLIFSLLKKDASFTLLVAAFIILILLFVMEKSLSRGLLIFAPLTIGLIWTMGAMGWFNIPLSIATVGLGAMILGLGVEYGVFMLTRYKEERDKGKDQLDSLLISVPGVGSAILGSGMTTIVGFLALTFSILSMMQNLGKGLALGIGSCLIASVFVAPVIILLQEDFEYWYAKKRHLVYTNKTELHKKNGK